MDLMLLSEEQAKKNIQLYIPGVENKIRNGFELCSLCVTRDCKDRA